jgi:DNA-binding NarL/FixJ family response regulator
MEALDKQDSANVYLVLMDLKMPVMNGVVATRKIAEKYSNTRVLILTTFNDDEWVFEAIRCGASGYLLNDRPLNELIKAIKGTVNGESYADPVRDEACFIDRRKYANATHSLLNSPVVNGY